MKLTGPKTLSERLEWMAKNLPGFAAELEEVAAIEQKAALNTAPTQRAECSHADILARIAFYSSNETANRLDWWSHPERQLMRRDPQWSLVYGHLQRAARIL
ncbi:MAG: hypothetical protein WKG03_04370 [Telluria sp.]